MQRTYLQAVNKAISRNVKRTDMPKGIAEIYSLWTSRGAWRTLLPLLRCYLGGEARRQDDKFVLCRVLAGSSRCSDCRGFLSMPSFVFIRVGLVPMDRPENCGTPADSDLSCSNLVSCCATNSNVLAANYGVKQSQTNFKTPALGILKNLMRFLTA